MYVAGYGFTLLESFLTTENLVVLFFKTFELCMYKLIQIYEINETMFYMLDIIQMSKKDCYSLHL